MKCSDCGATNVPLLKESWHGISVPRCVRCWKAWAAEYKPEALKQYEEEEEEKRNRWPRTMGMGLTEYHPEGEALVPKECAEGVLTIHEARARAKEGDVIYVFPGEQTYTETAPKVADPVSIEAPPQGHLDGLRVPERMMCPISFGGNSIQLVNDTGRELTFDIGFGMDGVCGPMTVRVKDVPKEKEPEPEPPPERLCNGGIGQAIVTLNDGSEYTLEIRNWSADYGPHGAATAVGLDGWVMG